MVALLLKQVLRLRLLPQLPVDQLLLVLPLLALLPVQ